MVDLVPHMGHMLEGFATVAEGRKTPLLYVPCYSGNDHQEWFEAHWMDDFSSSFQKGEFNIDGFERMES